MLNNLLQMHLKLLQKEQFKKQPGDLIVNKIVDNITKASKSLPQNSPETVENRKYRI